jgi:malate dehydrogenase (oxaloacetate-decarboxylating)
MSNHALPTSRPTGALPHTSPNVLFDPLLNKGTAFSAAERDAFHLHGLLPFSERTLDEQVACRLVALRSLATDLDRYVALRDLQDSNETLFYALLRRHTEELLPIVYTPTVGAGCQRFSHLFRHPRGLFVSYPYQNRIREMLAHPRFDNVKVIVVTDGERILGLGDLGAGGMGIPIGKLALYVACGGLHPATTLPVTLDVGTDNQANLDDPLYIGWRHERVRGNAYDEFIAAFIDAVSERWPNVLLQWEDFARQNAGRLLSQYRDRLCTFNDDIQGTAAVATGAILAALGKTGVSLAEQRVAILGGGSAGCGIAVMLRSAMIEAGLAPDEASRRIYMLDRNGLLTDDLPDVAGAGGARAPFVHSAAEVAGWKAAGSGGITLLDVMKNARPGILVGVCGQAGAFSEGVVREMASHCARPVIFPLSNPTSNCEATLADLVRWTDGRVVAGTGSPTAPVEYEGRVHRADQTNNAYIFPGVGLAAVALGIARLPDNLFMVAGRALASMSPARQDADAMLLPPVSALHDVACTIAVEVGMQAYKDGLLHGDITPERIEPLIRSVIWEPSYFAQAGDLQDGAVTGRPC